VFKNHTRLVYYCSALKYEVIQIANYLGSLVNINEVFTQEILKCIVIHVHLHQANSCTSNGKMLYYSLGLLVLQVFFMSILNLTQIA
jgi:hypothetical protein